MNERERMMAVLQGKTPDRTPWYGDLSYLYRGLTHSGRLDAKYHGTEGFIRFHEDLGVGACFCFDSLWSTDFFGGVGYNERQCGELTYYEYTTPVGNVRSVKKYLPTSYSWAYCEHFVKTIEDLRIMLYVCEHTRYTETYDTFRSRDTQLGGSGMMVGFGPCSAAFLQTMLCRWAGVETTIDLYMEHPEEFEEKCAQVQAAEDPLFAILEQAPTPYIELAENLSSEVTGKFLFEKFDAPYYKKRTDQLHRAGKIVGIHIDGTLKPCLGLLKACGFDVAEAVTPLPVGDVAVEELRSLAGEGIILWGGLPGALFSPVYSDQDFDSHLETVLDAFPPSSGFILGSADQVPPDAVVDRVKRVRREVEGRH